MAVPVLGIDEFPNIAECVDSVADVAAAIFNCRNCVFEICGKPDVPLRLGERAHGHELIAEDPATVGD